MIVDFWINAIDPRRFLGNMAWAGSSSARLPGVGADGSFEVARLVDDLVAEMDRLGIDVAVLNTELGADGRDAGVPTVESLLDATEGHAARFLVAAMPERAHRPLEQSVRVRALAAHERFALVRVVPMLEQVPIDDRLWYPLYATCAELGVPVSINVGLPGYATRHLAQHPDRLPDVLCDFPTLRVCAAHMGHPYETLLVGFLRRFPQLWLATTLFHPRDLAAEVLRFMDGDGRGRVIWGSDLPAMDAEDNLGQALALDVDADSRAAYLGGAALAFLGRT
jgi:predicted TIM-barrel fold metal-dependent hydrolase